MIRPIIPTIRYFPALQTMNETTITQDEDNTEKKNVKTNDENKVNVKTPDEQE